MKSIRSALFCKVTGNISSSPADMNGENDAIAHLILSPETIFEGVQGSPRLEFNGSGSRRSCELTHPGKCTSSKCWRVDSGEFICVITRG